MSLGSASSQELSKVSQLDARCPRSNVEEAHLSRVGFDELPSRLHLVAHERGEYLIRRRRILEGDIQQRAYVWIHRRLPQLFGVHLTKALEALQVHAFFGQRQNRGRQLVKAVGLLLFLAHGEQEGGLAQERLHPGKEIAHARELAAGQQLGLKLDFVCHPGPFVGHLECDRARAFVFPDDFQPIEFRRRRFRVQKLS